MALVSLISCRTGTVEILAEPSGRPGEVIVVMDDGHWKGEPGDALKHILSLPYEMLPQSEPVFDFFTVAPRGFRDFLLLHRNIIIAEIGPEITDTSMNVQYDVRAGGQVVIILKAPDVNTFTGLVSKSALRILAVLEENEMQKLKAGNKVAVDRDVSEFVKEKHRIILTVPQGYSVVADTSGFTWIMKESGSVLQGILIYNSYLGALKDASTEKLIAIRDSVLGRYVPGSVPGSYMTTEKDVPPLERRYSLRGRMNVVELRGLWKTESGISMGGPFISLTFQVPEKMCVSVEGFVFAAGYDKRDYVREVGAIVLSADLP